MAENSPQLVVKTKNQSERPAEVIIQPMDESWRKLLKQAIDLISKKEYQQAKKLNLPSEFLTLAAERVFLNHLMAAWVADVPQLVDNFNLDLSLLKPSRYKKALVKGIQHSLIGNRSIKPVNDLLITLAKYHLPENLRQQALEEALLVFVRSGSANFDDYIEFFLPDRGIKLSKQYKMATNEGFLSILAEEIDVTRAVEFAQLTQMSKKRQGRLAGRALLEILKAGHYGYWYLFDSFAISPKIKQSSQYFQAAQEGVANYCKSQLKDLGVIYIDRLVEFVEKLGLPKYQMVELYKLAMLSITADGWVVQDSYLDSLSIDRSFRSEERYSDARKQGFFNLWTKPCGAIHPQDFAKATNMSDQDVFESARLTILHTAKTDPQRALQLAKFYNFDEQLTLSLDYFLAVEKLIVKSLKKNNEVVLYQLKKDQPELIEFFSDRLKALLLKYLRARKIQTALLLNDSLLALPNQEAFDYLSPSLQTLFDGLPERAQLLVDQAKKSVGVLLRCFDYYQREEVLFQTLENNPFLVEALESNPTHGAKLVLRFITFDQVAREKIKRIFAISQRQKTLVADQPKSGSLLRFDVQEELRSFMSNSEILSEAQKNGVNLDAWLNFNEEQHFFLIDDGQKSANSVASQFFRIGQFFEQYKKMLRTELSPYRESLSSANVAVQERVVDPTLNRQVEAIQEKLALAKQQQNMVLIANLERALENITSKQSKEKILTAWEKIFNDFDLVDRLYRQLSVLFSSQINLEETIQQLVAQQAPVYSQIEAMSRQLSVVKEEIRLAFAKLVYRFSEFQLSLEKTATQAGLDYAQFITKLANQLNIDQQHYMEDIESFSGFYDDSGQRKKEELSNRPLSLNLWARNPDVDLYLGNYTSCCVSIEGDLHEERSPIADYVTDLGMQVVTITDEFSGQPVVAAWLWLGIDKDGRTAIVIDNIEANTDYSTNYTDLLSEKLFVYLKLFAKNCNVDELLMGIYYNDLPSQKMMNSFPWKAGYRSCRKIGGGNSRDNYYLEACMGRKMLKLVWEKEEQSFQ